MCKSVWLPHTSICENVFYGSIYVCVKSWLIWKDPDAGKDWGQEDKGTTEDEMVGWHHRLDGHGFGWTPGVGDGQGGLACCGSWGRKESDTTEQLNWTDRATRISGLKLVKLTLHVGTPCRSSPPPATAHRHRIVLYHSDPSCDQMPFHDYLFHLWPYHS